MNDHAASPTYLQAKWPFIEELLAMEALEFIDYAIAEHLLRSQNLIEDEIAVLICHLSMAVRAGHLCMVFQEDSFLPSVESLWKKEVPVTKDSKPLSQKTLEAISWAIFKGAKRLQELANPFKALIFDDNRLYFQRYFKQETSLIEDYLSLKDSETALKIDFSSINKCLNQFIEEGLLFPEQVMAIKKACSQPLTIIYGGPGTGKTYTAAFFLRTFWKALTDDQKARCTISIAAPTGKAAANFQKNISKILSQDFKNCLPSVQTLHKLLGKQPGKMQRETSALLSDVVIVDECSMIDVGLMSLLLASLKKGARLILIGDPFQLPSIEAGGIFSDLTRCELKVSPSIAAGLNVCQRTDLKEIVNLSQLILNGEGEKAWEALKQGNICTLLELDTVNTLESLKGLISPFFILPAEVSKDSRSSFDFFSKYRLLSPLRKGPLGIDTCNEYFLKKLIKELRFREYSAIPIIITKNDNQLNLFNGEVGVLFRKNVSTSLNSTFFHEGDYAVFEGEENNLKQIPAAMLPPYDYAFCLSIHKSQGSEFDHVMLLLPEGGDIFGREGLYTAVTRTRKKFEILTSKEIFLKTIAKSTQRLSGVEARLKKKTEKF